MVLSGKVAKLVAYHQDAGAEGAEASCPLTLNVGHGDDLALHALGLRLRKLGLGLGQCRTLLRRLRDRRLAALALGELAKVRAIGMDRLGQPVAAARHAPLDDVAGGKVQHGALREAEKGCEA